jgi:hypothetical protein
MTSPAPVAANPAASPSSAAPRPRGVAEKDRAQAVQGAAQGAGQGAPDEAEGFGAALRRAGEDVPNKASKAHAPTVDPAASAPAPALAASAGDPTLAALLDRLAALASPTTPHAVPDAQPASPDASPAAAPGGRALRAAPAATDGGESVASGDASPLGPGATLPTAAALHDAAPVALDAVIATRHLPPARIEAAPAVLGEAAAAARPALIEAPANPPPATQLRLALTPQGLGEIEVTLRLRGGRLEASLAADRPATAALVESRRGDLADALRRAGYDVDPAAVAARVRPVEPTTEAARSAETGRDADRRDFSRERGAGERHEGARPDGGRQEGARDQNRRPRPRFPAGVET